MDTFLSKKLMMALVLIAALAFLAACDNPTPGPLNPRNDSSEPANSAAQNTTGENIEGVFSDNDGEVKPPIIPN